MKVASVYMEEDNATDAFKSFEDAIKMDPKDADIYYHRGQGERSFSRFLLSFEAYDTQ